MEIENFGLGIKRKELETQETMSFCAVAKHNQLKHIT